MGEASSKFWQLGLLGYPLEHSLSPLLHTAALHAAGLAGEYCLHAVPPDAPDDVGRLLDRVREGEIDGLNVTIPYKQTVLPYLDELTPVATAIEAVNTIYARWGYLVGDNTDAPGFLNDIARIVGWPLSDLRPAGRELPSALILGAGGSARAVAYALSYAGWHVWVAARRLEQARKLTASLRQRISTPIHHITFTGLPVLFDAVAPRFDLLVNATPVGMAPEGETSPWPDKLELPRGAFVYDLVYNPPETALLRAAREANLPAANGLGMLVEQAALSFERWTGCVAPRAATYRAVSLNI